MNAGKMVLRLQLLPLMLEIGHSNGAQPVWLRVCLV